MKYCHNCGYKLTLGTEIFCPDCGQNLIQERTNIGKKVGITDTGRDVIGTDVSGTGHIIGREVGYTVQGNVINLQISGGVSNELLQTLQKMIAIPTQVKSTISLGGREHDNKGIKEKQEAAIETKQQISQVLEDVNKISNKEGRKIQEIKAGDLNISTKELSVNEIMLKGNEHYYKGEYSETLKWYDKAIEMDPNSASAWYNKGLSLDYLGKYEEAIKCYDKAIEIDPNDTDIWYNKGLALYNLEKYNDAIACYDKAIEIDPNDTDIWYNKGLALDDSEKYNEALKNYDKALALNPNYVDAWNNKGLILDDMEKYNDAIACYDKAIALNPNHVDAWNNKGVALSNLEKYNDAIACYDKAIEINEKYVNAWYNRAIYKNKMKYKAEEVLADLRKSIEIGGEDYRRSAVKDMAFKNLKYNKAFKLLLKTKSQVV